MKSALLGTDTLEVEVTNISKHGFWLLLKDRELFVPFSEFPWFKEATIAQLINVEWPDPHHLYWPDLDIDLAVESIEHPERFLLVSTGCWPAGTPALPGLLHQPHPHIGPRRILDYWQPAIARHPRRYRRSGKWLYPLPPVHPPGILMPLGAPKP